MRGLSERSTRATSSSMVMWVSLSSGRIGPVNCGLVGTTWPNRSSSPGPDRLKSGTAAPTCAVWPAADTVCSGATCSASQIEPAVTIMKVTR